jgi:D-alanine transaminase
MQLMKVLWNEKIVDREEVRIDIEDRGYQYGDGIYEVIRIYQGKMFMAKEHFQRLANSAAKIKMALPYDTEILRDKLCKLIEIEEITDGEVYLQVTRGVLSPRNHVFPPQGSITGVLTANVIPFQRPLAMQEEGLKATLIPDQRWLHCDIKSLSLLGNLLSLEEARSAGFDEALLHREGFFTEASASNLWFVSKGTVYTHPDGNLVLPGITKMKVLALCQELAIPVKEEAVAIDRLAEFDECFITNSVWEIVPIVAVDGLPVGEGRRGAVTSSLQQAYIEATKRN